MRRTTAAIGIAWAYERGAPLWPGSRGLTFQGTPAWTSPPWRRSTNASGAASNAAYGQNPGRCPR
eukprot:6446435-Lingulodinium_polyedra.AAC.1